MTKLNVETNGGASYKGADAILSLIFIFGIMPFLMMFVWNVLVVGFFAVSSVGYGGAWVLMVIRSFFFKTTKSHEDDTPKKSLERTVKYYMLAVMIIVTVFIVGYANGYL